PRSRTFPTTSPAATSVSPGLAPSVTRRLAPPRRSPSISRPGSPPSSSPGREKPIDGFTLMVALRGREVDAYLARPDPGRPIVLLYGPDAGLVRERADALIASAVDDPNDPFSLVHFAGGIDALADAPIKDCRIVIEAGELRPEAPLRKACERAKTAVAIACYPDGERDLAKLIDDELRLSGLRIAPEARAALTALLGGDRQASRNELRKLTLFAHGQGEVTLEDVMAVVADASELKIDPIVDGAFAGKPELVETEFAKAMVAGTYPGMIISAAQR